MNRHNTPKSNVSKLDSTRRPHTRTAPTAHRPTPPKTGLEMPPYSRRPTSRTSASQGAARGAQLRTSHHFEIRTLLRDQRRAIHSQVCQPGIDTFIRYTERLAEFAAVASVASVGGSLRKHACRDRHRPLQDRAHPRPRPRASAPPHRRRVRHPGLGSLAQPPNGTGLASPQRLVRDLETEWANCRQATELLRCDAGQKTAQRPSG